MQLNAQGEMLRTEDGKPAQAKMTVPQVESIVRRMVGRLFRGPEFVITTSTNKELFPETGRRGRVSGSKGAFLHDQPNRVLIFADSAQK